MSAPLAARRAAYEAAAASDSHTASCPSCTAGRTCGTADDYMTAEYRAGTDLATADPYAARAFARAGIPREGE